MSEQALPRPLRYALQALAYGAFAALLGTFSTAPAYRLRADNEAVLKLSFTHSGRLAHACRERSERLRLLILTGQRRSQFSRLIGGR